MSQQPTKNEGPKAVPSAPYPPMISTRYPSTQLASLRSSLSTSPHYTAANNYAPRVESSVPPSSNGIPSTVNSLIDEESREESSRQTICTAKETSRVQFCQPDMLACINCAGDKLSFSRSFSYSSDEDNTGTPVRGNRSRKGPVLLELKRLHLNQHRDTGSKSLFTTSTICLSRGNPSLGISSSSTCLDVLRPYGTTEESTLPTCATGLTTGALCVHSFRNDKDDSSEWIPTVEYYHMPRHHRQATAVKWRPSNPQAVIGLVAGSGGAANAGGPQSSRRAGSAVASTVGLGGTRATAGDREYCCFVWDVEHQSASSRRTRTTPLYKLSHQMGVASLEWILENGQTLAVGGQLRNLLLYDLRTAGQSTSPPVTVYAHNFGVHGIEMDPARPWQFATYCHAVNEPVKLWDARRMESCINEIKISGIFKESDGSRSMGFAPAGVDQSSQPVNSVKWSIVEPGILSVAVGDAVYDYDASTSSSRAVHTGTVHAKETILDFALYPYSNSSSDASGRERKTLDMKLISELYPNRMVVVQKDRTIADLAKHTIAPIAVSRRDGRLVHALGRTMWIGAPGDGPAAMESLQIKKDEDISATMMRRARCLQSAMYSMDTASNVKMLAEDGILAEDTPLEGPSQTRDALLRLWSWVERVESLCFEVDDSLGEGTSWPARGLVDAGAYRLLNLDTGTEDEKTYSEVLSCATYDSPGRRAALTSCGWAGKFELNNVLGECEDLGDYERSAALSVWHADIGAAVEALQRGATFIRTEITKNKRKQDPRITFHYAETLELVALCIAGYRGGDLESPSSQIWRKACANLMERNDLSGAITSSGRIAYIRGLLNFLKATGTDNRHQEILGYGSLSLCDRVAFACRFLSRNELKSFLEKCILDCQKTGNVEGVTITGIEKEGVKILQSYVDRYADVQTAALITSRVIFPASWTLERRIIAEWLEAYRSLLNSWQMWQSRAMFDVDRADLLRKVKMLQTDGAMASGGKTAANQSGRRLSQGRRPGTQQPDPDIQASIPAQLDARCNYCSSPLGLRQKDIHANQWLSKMKPVLSCCPQCRKPLPRCAICMLSLGALNPYLELTKERSRPTRGTGTTLPSADDMSSLANLPFAEWFTWCMRCKHGGHAHHLVGWFANHEVCPVSGCDCRCQFDGIEKLNRPALSRSTHNSEREISEGGPEPFTSDV